MKMLEACMCSNGWENAGGCVGEAAAARLLQSPLPMSKQSHRSSSCSLS